MPKKHIEENTIIKTDPDTVFELRNVSFGYIGEQIVLKNINLKIKKGEVIALLGYNGAGKTTLVNLLLNLCKPTSGEILLYGQPYSKYSDEDIKKNIGIYFQKSYLFHSTIKENIGFGNIENINNVDKIHEAINNGGADKLISKLPQGLDTWYGKSVEREGVILSGGEQQKISLSRTYMSDRDIMIFDEPASALDPIAEMEQFMNIKKKVKNSTSILISHRIGFARLADRIIVLDSGEIVENGTHGELIKNNGSYSYFYNQQAKWYDNTDKEEKVDE